MEHTEGLHDEVEVNGPCLHESFPHRSMNFKGEMRVGKLMLDGKPQPAGTYSAATSPAFIKGTGVLKAQ